jgi:hypothetical protein
MKCIKLMFLQVVVVQNHTQYNNKYLLGVNKMAHAPFVIMHILNYQ